jgi:hypothetical protein
MEVSPVERGKKKSTEEHSRAIELTLQFSSTTSRRAAAYLNRPMSPFVIFDENKKQSLTHEYEKNLQVLPPLIDKSGRH